VIEIVVPTTADSSPRFHTRRLAPERLTLSLVLRGHKHTSTTRKVTSTIDRCTQSLGFQRSSALTFSPVSVFDSHGINELRAPSSLQTLPQTTPTTIHPVQQQQQSFNAGLPIEQMVPQVLWTRPPINDVNDGCMSCHPYYQLITVILLFHRSAGLIDPPALR